MGQESSLQRWSRVLPIYQFNTTTTMNTCTHHVVDLLSILKICSTTSTSTTESFHSTQQQQHPKLVQWSKQTLLYVVPSNHNSTYNNNGLYWNDEQQQYRYKVSFTISITTTTLSKRSNHTSRIHENNNNNKYHVHIMGSSSLATSQTLINLLQLGSCCSCCCDGSSCSGGCHERTQNKKINDKQPQPKQQQQQQQQEGTVIVHTIELNLRSEMITPTILQQIVQTCTGCCSCCCSNGGSTQTHREYLFSNIALTSQECYTLALYTTGIVSKLIFMDCIFLDNGKAFQCGIQERNHHHNPISISFLGHDPPFPYFHSFLQMAPLYTLELGMGFPLSKMDCEILANKIHHMDSLILEQCRWEDYDDDDERRRGSVLLFSTIAFSKGPRHLQLSYKDTDDPVQFNSYLMTALSSDQCQVQSICLTGSTTTSIFDSLSWQSLIQTILLHNKSIHSLEICSFVFTNNDWDHFLSNLSQNQTIERLYLYNIIMTSYHSNMTNQLHPLQPHDTNYHTHRLRNILHQNQMIEEMEIYNCPFVDPSLWKNEILPIVLNNQYQKRFSKIHCDPNGAALLPYALAQLQQQQQQQQDHHHRTYILLQTSLNLLFTFGKNEKVGFS